MASSAALKRLHDALADAANEWLATNVDLDEDPDEHDARFAAQIERALDEARSAADTDEAWRVGDGLTDALEEARRCEWSYPNEVERDAIVANAEEHITKAHELGWGAARAHTPPKPLPEFDPATVAAVVELLRDGALIEATFGLAPTGPRIMALRIAQHIESHERFKADGTGGQS